MKKDIELQRPRLSRTEFRKRAQGFLESIQKAVAPERSRDVVAINMETGEYVLGHDSDEAFDAYQARWPDVLAYICRVDGGPSTKFYGK